MREREQQPPPHWWTDLPPAAGAFVMATGIISVGLHLTGYEPLSLVAFALAGVAWVLLAGEFVSRLFEDRRRWRSEADTPPALTAVAATAVLGVRASLYDWPGLAYGLLALATLVWPFLLVSVIRHWHRGMPGAAFLTCVATQALAVLAGTLSLAGHGEWLARAALACFLLGLVLYGEALARFDFRQVREGLGDQWVAGGALAISALAGSKLTASPVFTGTAHDVLRTATLVLVGLDLAWYVVLLFAEARWPRPAYDIRRWSTVFPLGMTSVACLSTAAATGVDWLESTGRVLLWIALGFWVVTAGGLVLSVRRRNQSQGISPAA
ncbi:tellurite resistance/C4-dicarboxylate transporter family protein [Streptomyces sp. NPDC101132]|uniref:tellurite resistance/C4-dicarboxylate transporter family protein n=1 Tax=Streptomyces sp. NPDC101132 TaxID=3366110 RepID=UPI00382518C3